MDAAERSVHEVVRRDYRSSEKGGKEWYYALGLSTWSGIGTVGWELA